MAIEIKPSHKGLLHKSLGVPQGKKIPAKKLAAAKNSPDAATRKRATFAENAKKWVHGSNDEAHIGPAPLKHTHGVNPKMTKPCYDDVAGYDEKALRRNVRAGLKKAFPKDKDCPTCD